jgi:hypothetical protein
MDGEGVKSFVEHAQYSGDQPNFVKHITDKYRIIKAV